MKEQNRWIKGISHELNDVKKDSKCYSVSRRRVELTWQINATLNDIHELQNKFRIAN